MPIELKGSIQLKDITAIEFRCKNCGHASIHKLDDSLRLPVSCGNCNSPFPKGWDEHAVHRALREWAQEGPYSLRLHVEGLEGSIPARPAP
jgi:hypothetical protein